MICLTADVHHMTMGGVDQKHLRGTEVDAALQYADIARSRGLRLTFFVTGACVAAETGKLRDLFQMDGVELGGHTYNAFKPKLVYALSHRLLSLANGPRMLQKYDIWKTITVFRETLGHRIESWRNHAYRQDRNTLDLLRAQGIRFLSDQVEPSARAPRHLDGLCHVPINVITDHNFVYHGDRQPGRFDESGLRASPFATPAMGIHQWSALVKDQVESVVETGGLATMLVHPSCMELADDFRSFRVLCDHLAQYQSRTISEVCDLACGV
jgi:Polysaccharide deacetylase